MSKVAEIVRTRLNHLLTVTDANGHTTTYTYDVQDRIATRTDPLGHVETYSYDGNGNLTQFTDRKGQVSQFDYDELDRRTHAGYADGSFTNFTFDPVGRLTQINDSVSGYIQMGYDDLDRLTQEFTPLGVVTYTFDAIGRRTTMTVNGLSPVTYDYDDASRLTQVAQASQAVNLGYDVSGRRTSLTYSNGTNTSYFYDDASRVTEIFHNGLGGPIEDLFYSYDAAGNRISFSRTGPQADLPAPVQAAHNAANQLVQFNSDNLTYDLNGNLTFDGTTTYTWDARNRLVQLSGLGILASFTYDAMGRRIRKSINSNVTDFQYDGNDIISEIGNSTVGITYLRSLRIDEPFVRQGSTNEYFHIDALGSTMALTDGGGSAQTTYAYEPFGETTISGASTNVFQYTGRENDGTGLYHYRSRYFSQFLNRFISEDPLQFYPGNFDLYTYVVNNPLSFTDPFGLRPGDPYPTQDAAAIDAINDINPTSVNQDSEYGGYIYQQSDGNYSYTPPVTNNDPHGMNGMGPPPKDGTITGDYHTHGAESGPNVDDENFSVTDKNDNNGSGTTGYLGTPSGKIKKYTPPTGPVTDITPPGGGSKNEGGRK